jgi:hypothetical protein
MCMNITDETRRWVLLPRGAVGLRHQLPDPSPYTALMRLVLLDTLCDLRTNRISVQHLADRAALLRANEVAAARVEAVLYCQKPRDRAIQEARRITADYFDQFWDVMQAQGLGARL